jgi:hypothetical protein
MRLIAIFIIILGLAGLVLGVVFITQATSAEKQVLDSIAPLTLSDINPKYDAVSATFKQMLPVQQKIASNTASAQEMDQLNYVSSQRALLGLAKSNAGLAMFIRLNGITVIVLGIGMGLAGFALLKKA